jgi:hypothetical protein
MQSRAIVYLACTIALAMSGCATAIKGTTQRVAVVTVPAGAQCALNGERAPVAVVVAMTPGEAEIRRDSAPLALRCAKEGHLDVTTSYASSPMEHGYEVQNRQVVASDALVRQYQRSEAAQVRAREEADLQRNQAIAAGTAAGVAAASLPITLLATAAPTLGGGAAVAGAGLVAAPLFLGLLVTLPISFVVDLATGAMYSYPAVLLAILPPATFVDEASRTAYFAEIDRHFAVAGQALQDDTKANCWIACSGRIKDDEAFVADWRARVVGNWARTKIAGATAEIPVNAE